MTGQEAKDAALARQQEMERGNAALAELQKMASGMTWTYDQSTWMSHPLQPPSPGLLSGGPLNKDEVKRFEDLYNTYLQALHPEWEKKEHAKASIEKGETADSQTVNFSGYTALMIALLQFDLNIVGKVQDIRETPAR